MIKYAFTSLLAEYRCNMFRFFGIPFNCKLRDPRGLTDVSLTDDFCIINTKKIVNFQL